MHHSHIRQCPLYIIVRGKDVVGLDLGSILQIEVANAVNAREYMNWVLPASSTRSNVIATSQKGRQ